MKKTKGEVILMGKEFDAFAENFSSRFIKNFRSKHPKGRTAWKDSFDDDSHGFSVTAGTGRNAIDWYVTVFIKQIKGLDRLRLKIGLSGTPVSKNYELPWDKSSEPSDYTILKLMDVADRMFALAYYMEERFDAYSGIDIEGDELPV